MDEEKALITPETGLTAQQVQEHLEAGLGAGLPADSGRSEKEIILRHSLTFFNLVFIVLAVLLIVGKSTVMNMGFLGVVVINTVIGIFQEIRAKRAVDKLSLVARRPVKVVRDGQVQEVPPENIVRDDLAEFGQGDQICGDGILQSGTLYVDESLLTGEEDSVEKQPGDLVHSGSVVLAGRGRVLLTAVGENCGAAALAREAKYNPKNKKSEMMRSLDRLIVFLGIVLVPVGIILFRQEYVVLQLPLRESTEGTVAALIGMIPEGLYLLTSVALAVSAQKLSKSRVLVQDMNSIEALARVDMLCVDKTGTITEPDMEVENVLPLSDLLPEQLEDILTAMYGTGEPDNATAKAMQELFSGESDLKCTNRVPFSSEYKWSGCEFENSGSYVFGAPEFLLGDREDKWNIGDWAAKGYRVLLLAQYDGPLAPGKLDPEKLEPLALALLTGKLRPNAKETFAYFAQQGVTVKVISGDNPATVSMIAQQAEIPNSEKYVDASTLETPEQLRKAADEYTVFGRVTPQQKKALIEALQKKKHTVAMTGDGVNDLLAMKQADCAIAMASGAEAGAAGLGFLRHAQRGQRRPPGHQQYPAGSFPVPGEKHIFPVFIHYQPVYGNALSPGAHPSVRHLRHDHWRALLYPDL